MPELPEVERARALIADRALGRVIARVDDTDTFVCRPHAPGEIAAALEGAALTEAHRRGKAMWVETDRGPVLGLHLGMAGRMVVDEPPAPNGWDRFVIDFEDGGRLALRDKRRLGRAVLDPDMTRVGPDAAEVSRAEFRRRVGRGTAPLKARIMDQATIAGVGNLLADQTLWQARLSPLTPAASWTTISSMPCAAHCGPPRAARSAGAACTPATSSTTAGPTATARAVAARCGGRPSAGAPPTGARSTSPASGWR
jgi:formamidopyrimidine-DNA glycosylase